MMEVAHDNLNEPTERPAARDVATMVDQSTRTRPREEALEPPRLRQTDTTAAVITHHQERDEGNGTERSSDSTRLREVKNRWKAHQRLPDAIIAPEANENAMQHHGLNGSSTHTSSSDAATTSGASGKFRFRYRRPGKAVAHQPTSPDAHAAVAGEHQPADDNPNHDHSATAGNQDQEMNHHLQQDQVAESSPPPQQPPRRTEPPSAEGHDNGNRQVEPPEQQPPEVHVEAYLVNDAVAVRASASSHKDKLPTAMSDDAAAVAAAVAQGGNRGRILTLLVCCVIVVVAAVAVGVSVALTTRTTAADSSDEEEVESSEGHPAVPTTAPPPTSGGSMPVTMMPPRPCLRGAFYASYERGKKIGYVDLLGGGSSVIQELSSPDCGNMRYVAFDREGNAHGVCENNHQDDDQYHYYSFVAIDLASGNTTEIFKLPKSEKIPKLAYNSKEDSFYCLLGPNDDNITFAKIAKTETGWSMSYVILEDDPGELRRHARALATDSNGNSFAIRGAVTELVSVNLVTGKTKILGRLSFRTYTLAFDPRNEASSSSSGKTTLYSVGYRYPAPLHTIRVTDADASADQNITSTWIQDTNASFASGGDICPLL